MKLWKANRMLGVVAAFQLCAVSLLCQETGTGRISVDASKITGTMKRVNDIDNGPLVQRGIIDLTRFYKELGIRNVRLHDVPWVYDNVLDINYVFPNWDADPQDPKSYDFKQSDFYIKTITDLGINIVYRLGYSAEYKTSVRHSDPPSSFEKWASVCQHIVRHYNQGWANGPRANIRFWEIGNEPDGMNLVFWSGPQQEFFRLYDMTARKIKEVDPTLKVGGPAIAGSLSFLENFLKYGQQHNSPIDFASWHIYTRDAHEVAKRARAVNELQVKYGFGKTESILDEWNLAPLDWTAIFTDADAGNAYFVSTKNAEGAAFDDMVMTELQDAPIDIATFYSGSSFMWGLFTEFGAPETAYYAFLAMQRMMETPRRLQVTKDTPPTMTALAGISQDQKTVRVLVTALAGNASSYTLSVSGLPWNGPTRCERRVIDTSHSFEEARVTHVEASPTITDQSLGPKVTLYSFQPDSK